jgi:acyl carrier protein phosphodiesterase
MNFLAHLFLSGDSEHIMVGNFIGDFVKGNQLKTYPTQVQAGIVLHRRIDAYTDSHAAVKQSTIRLSADFGRYSAVIVDVFYDHFLAKHFEKYADLSLSLFAESTYQLLERHLDILPERVQEFLPYMRTQNWLVRYADFDGIRRSLGGIARRAKYAENLEQAIFNFQNEYEDFEQDFLLFFPDLRDMAQNYLREYFASSTSEE